MKGYNWWILYFSIFLAMYGLLRLVGMDFGSHFTNIANEVQNSYSFIFSLTGLVAFFSLWGLNFSFWGIMGFLRFLEEKFTWLEPPENYNKEKIASTILKEIFKPDDVAIIVPAHNEELVIAKTINSLLRLVNPSNIFVISDGSVDKTAQLARDFGVNVLELSPANGKAGALKAGIEHFALGSRFKAVLFVDADTVLPPDYLEEALPSFSDPSVVAVAGYARTLWEPAKQTFWQKYFVSHREMVYSLSQMLLKYGQTWRHTNVATIIPGFASIYRASVLKNINLNPPGLVIEDFNMTFEVHHKRLGRIVLNPKVSGYTQDPDNLKDYFRQVKRWDLGFWQTIRLHGIWPSKFFLALVLFVAEVFLSSLTLLIIPVILALLLLLVLIPQIMAPAMILLTLIAKIILFGLWLPSIFVSLFIGIAKKRPQYFYYAPLFIFLKFIDSAAFLYTLPKAFLTQSSGRWVSPSRRVE